MTAEGFLRYHEYRDMQVIYFTEHQQRYEDNTIALNRAVYPYYARGVSGLTVRDNRVSGEG